jgi:hypothetical protein
LLTILYLVRYEDWTVREAEVRQGEHRELRHAPTLMRVPDFTIPYRSLQSLDARLRSSTAQSARRCVDDATRAEKDRGETAWRSM